MYYAIFVFHECFEVKGRRSRRKWRRNDITGRCVFHVMSGYMIHRRDTQDYTRDSITFFGKEEHDHDMSFTLLESKESKSWFRVLNWKIYFKKTATFRSPKSLLFLSARLIPLSSRNLHYYESGDLTLIWHSLHVLIDVPLDCESFLSTLTFLSEHLRRQHHENRITLAVVLSFFVFLHLISWKGVFFSGKSWLQSNPEDNRNK